MDCWLFTLTYVQQVNALDITPDKSMIAVAGGFVCTFTIGMCIIQIIQVIAELQFWQFQWHWQCLLPAGYQHIRLFDLNSMNPNPLINYDGVSKNVTAVGFHSDMRWMYTGGEDSTARIWDLR
jgi:WD40 repeat protein